MDTEDLEIDFPHLPKGRNWVTVTVTRQCSLSPTPPDLHNFQPLQGPPESSWSHWRWLSCARKLVFSALFWFLPVLFVFCGAASSVAARAYETVPHGETELQIPDPQASSGSDSGPAEGNVPLPRQVSSPGMKGS